MSWRDTRIRGQRSCVPIVCQRGSDGREREKAILGRIDRLVGRRDGSSVGDAEVFHGAISIIAQLYGAGSPQLEELRKGGAPPLYMGAEALGALVSARADLDAGLIGSLRQQLTGGVLADFVALSREALSESTSGSDNVAAVLAAAAYEDTIRRLGREKAGILDRRKLDQVLEALKVGGVLTDTQFTVAQGYLNLRNNALHADFAKIERASTASVLAFVEELLIAHFS